MALETASPNAGEGATTLSERKISYEDSELIKNLKDYNIVPPKDIRRKMDYFFSPYNPQYNTEKYMNFKEYEGPKENKKPNYKDDSEKTEE